MEQVFLFTFNNGVLIVFDRRKNNAEWTSKRKRIVFCKQFFPASGLPIHREASDNFPAKN